MGGKEEGGHTLEHSAVGLVTDGEDVGGHLLTLPALVHGDNLVSVEGEAAPGVDHDQEETGVGLTR